MGLQRRPYGLTHRKTLTERWVIENRRDAAPQILPFGSGEPELHGPWNPRVTNVSREVQCKPSGPKEDLTVKQEPFP